MKDSKKISKGFEVTDSMVLESIDFEYKRRGSIEMPFFYDVEQERTVINLLLHLKKKLSEEAVARLRGLSFQSLIPELPELSLLREELSGYYQNTYFLKVLDSETIHLGGMMWGKPSARDFIGFFEKIAKITRRIEEDRRLNELEKCGQAITEALNDKVYYIDGISLEHPLAHALPYHSAFATKTYSQENLSINTDNLLPEDRKLILNISVQVSKDVADFYPCYKIYLKQSKEQPDEFSFDIFYTTNGSDEGTYFQCGGTGLNAQDLAMTINQVTDGSYITKLD